MRGKYVLFTVFLCAALVGCETKTQINYGEISNTAQDSQNFSTLRDATATQNGFYDIQENYIYFTDIKTEKTVPVCGKLNCKHTDSSCNAYFDAPLNVQAYDGNIYVVARGGKSGTMSLYCMNEDGSEREELKTLYAYEAGDASCSLDFVIHRGYGYMVTNWVQNDREEKEQTLYRISLNSSDKKEELAKIKGYTPMIYIVEGVGNHIYFKTSRYTDQDGQNLEIVNYELNIMTDKVQKIDLPSGLSIIAAKNNQYICLEQDGTGVITYNKTEKKAKTLFKWDYDNTLVYHDEKYLYLDNEVYLILHDKPDADRRIVVIDYNGNKLCEWKKFGETMLKFFWSDSERLLLQNTEDGTFQLLKLTDVSRFE